MALNSLLTNVAALRAQTSLGEANRANVLQVSRLSSGDRIQRAADDVASLSTGTSLQTNVTTLRRAMLNTAQGQTLLQVADGAVAEITDLLLRQKAIATQAGSGSITPADRGFLNQEFQQLTQEIDRIARETNFNGVKLLDGSLFEATFIEQDTNPARMATATLTFTDNIADQKVTVLNGVFVEFDDAGDGANSGAPITLAVDTTAIAGGTPAQYVDALANALNNANNALLSGASYEAIGTTLRITSRQGGIVPEEYVIDSASSTTSYNLSARNTNEVGIFTLQGGSNRGIAAGETTGIGPIGDSIVATQTQTRAFMGLNFENATHNPPVFTDFPDGSQLIFDDGDAVGAGNVTFEFDSANPAALSSPEHVRIDISGATTKAQVLDSIVASINQYEGLRNDGTRSNDDYMFRQFEARREANEVVIETYDTDNIFEKQDSVSPITTAFISVGVGNLVITGSDVWQNAANSGITTSGVNNPDFVGLIQGFKATYTGIKNVVNFEITVGDRTYLAPSVQVSNPGTNRVRFISDKGDYFDIDFIQPTVNLPVETQEVADLLAVRLDKALKEINFYQSRDITSYVPAGDILADGEPIGTLTGTSFTLQKADFSVVRIDDIFVGEPLEGTSDAIIEFTINGVIYRSRPDIGSSFGPHGVFRFTSLKDANDILTFRTGDINLTDTSGNPVNTIQFDTETKAIALEEALKKAFGIGKSGQTLNFQVGVETVDRLQISISSVTSERLFSGQELNVLTRDAAKAASDTLDRAIDYITSVRADIGSQQSRFDFASANIESSLLNQEAARGVLLDTDVAVESTNFAVGQVEIQAGVSVLAQANLIPQSFLKLLGTQ